MDRPKIFTFRFIIQMLLFVVGIPFLPLLISRRWDWWEAWVYAGIYIGGFVPSRALATPIFLDAAWAFLPALFISVALVLRTALEDQTLQSQLPGYREYAQRVRYRLLPGVW